MASQQKTRCGGEPRRSALPAFFVVYLLVAILWHPPRWTGIVYLAASLLTFIAYAADKAAARRGGWRTSEGTLHTLALLGGWPGALLAQQWLRHKSTKQQFRSVFWGTVVLNVGAYVLVCSPFGQQLWTP